MAYVHASDYVRTALTAQWDEQWAPCMPKVLLHTHARGAQQRVRPGLASPPQSTLLHMTSSYLKGEPKSASNPYTPQKKFCQQLALVTLCAASSGHPRPQEARKRSRYPCMS